MIEYSYGSNFQFLEQEYPILANIAASAEYNCYADPTVTLFKLRQFGEHITNINAQKLSKFEIPYCAIEEQNEIVHRLESLFTKADAIEQQYQTLKQKIDTLPQALLAKAFKRELVEQLESDGDARELLEEIRKLKLNATKK
jgi:type I restriction enzyme S subunit